MKRLSAAAVAALSLAVIPFIAGAQEGSAPVATGSGEFSVACGVTEDEPDAFSHRGTFDPIVFPGQKPAGHSHDFIGNKSTDEFSTNDGSDMVADGDDPTDLRAHLTTCVRPSEDKNAQKPLNSTAYWVPTLIEGTRNVAPHEVAVAYHVGKRVRDVEPYPADFKMITGDATGQTPNNGIFDWRCGSSSGGTVTPGTATTFPQCVGPGLRQTIDFPDCWDGVRSDSPTHKAHVAFSFKNAQGYNQCPASHPEQLPILRIQLHYNADGGSDTRLASGGIQTSHADFMNGWDEDHLAWLVEACLNGDTYCGNAQGPHPNRD